MKAFQSSTSRAAGTPPPWYQWLTASWRPLALVAVAAIAAYAPSAGSGFTDLDDHHLIVTNGPALRDPANALRAFGTDVFWRTDGIYYRPLLNLSLMLDAWWAGTRPWPYHCVNILLHALCALLLWWLARLQHAGRGLATASALLFAVHPVTVQTVAWLPGRNDLLLAVCLLLAMASFVRFIRTSRWQWGAVHVACLALALFTKETAVVAPLLLALYLVAIERPRSWQTATFLVIGGWVVLIIGWVLLRRSAVPAAGMMLPGAGAIGDAVNGILLYTGKCVLPFNLSVLPVPPDINVLWGLAAIAALSLAALAGGVASPRRCWFWAAWYLLLLAPTFARYGPFIDYMENRLYLPLAGFLLLFGEFKALRAPRRARGWLAGAFVLWLLVMAVLTVLRERAFRDGPSFWADAVRTSPGSYFAHGMLGREHYQHGRLAAAESEYRLCVVLNPRYPLVYGDLGYLYVQRGDFARALPQWQAAVRLMPDNAGLYYNLATCYNRTNRAAEAERYYRRAIVLQPDMGEAHDGLGVVMLQQGHPAPAIAALVRAAELLPDDARVLDHLARAYATAGDADQADACYTRALAMGLRPDPSFIGALGALRKQHTR